MIYKLLILFNLLFLMWSEAQLDTFWVWLIDINQVITSEH